MESSHYLVSLSYLTLSAEMVHADLDQRGPAGQAVNQAQQLTQHDRTPSLIMAGKDNRRTFQAVFAAPGKQLRRSVE
ncbi:hypothetical protein JQ631_17215 [Bradyrhizobium manausense]|uniref:hypothetical protein n=1 Tax=Bradyrhizobium manausense TaxID=989370 RepID=UPI001BABD53A|nr:hypothetical protein [Bradyrhizobium manausense]MBR0790818.1 hypothetical protein [Bradyrhizobium manausense]